MKTLDYLFGPGATMQPAAVVSHAAFGGIGVAAVLGLFSVGSMGGGTPLAALAVVGAFCIASALIIGALSQRSGVSEDTAIGVLLVASMALGFLLLQVHRARPGSAPISVESVLFGDVATTGPSQAIAAWVVLGASVACMVLARRPLLFWAFDEPMAETLGVRVLLVKAMLMVLLAVSIVVTMQLAGVILATAMLVLPGAAALQLSKRLARVVVLSLVLSLGGVIAGLVLSFEVHQNAPVIAARDVQRPPRVYMDIRRNQCIVDRDPGEPGQHGWDRAVPDPQRFGPNETEFLGRSARTQVRWHAVQISGDDRRCVPAGDGIAHLLIVRSEPGEDSLTKLPRTFGARGKRVNRGQADGFALDPYIPGPVAPTAGQRGVLLIRSILKKRMRTEHDDLAGSAPPLVIPVRVARGQGFIVEDRIEDLVIGFNEDDQIRLVGLDQPHDPFGLLVERIHVHGEQAQLDPVRSCIRCHESRPIDPHHPREGERRDQQEQRCPDPATEDALPRSEQNCEQDALSHETGDLIETPIDPYEQRRCGDQRSAREQKGPHANQRDLPREASHCEFLSRG